MPTVNLIWAQLKEEALKEKIKNLLFTNNYEKKTGGNKNGIEVLKKMK